MNRLKYPEKRHLSKYDLSNDLFIELGIKVIDIIPLRKVFLIKTETGNIILKLMDVGLDRIEFIDKCIKTIYKKYKNIIRFRKFESGKPYIEWKNRIYIIMDILKGREAAFTSEIEYKMCIRALAQMHIGANQGLTNKDIRTYMDEPLFKKFDKNLEIIISIKNDVNKFKYKNEFDELFLQNADKIINQIKQARTMLDIEKYKKYRENRDNITICHNDLTNHNFLISGEDVYIIDFDYCSIDLKVMDIADILLKGIKNAAFDFDKAILSLNEYSSVNELYKQDYYMIYILMMYPKEMISIIQSYYYKQKQWDYEVFLDRLKNKISNDEFRDDFLEQYYTQLRF